MRQSLCRVIRRRRSEAGTAAAPHGASAISAACVVAACSVACTNSAHGGEVWISDANQGLGKVDTQTGAVTMIGQTSLTLFDIAFDSNGDLWGVHVPSAEYTELYRVDTSTAELTYVGTMRGGVAVNALTFGPDGTLYGASTAGTIFSINTQTGQATKLGETGFTSAGDLAFLGNDLYFSSGLEFSPSLLVGVSLQPVSGTLIGSMGVVDTWGLASVDGKMIGAAGTTLYSIDVGTGSATPLVGFGGKGLVQTWGMASQIPTPSFLVCMGILTLMRTRRRR